MVKDTSVLIIGISKQVRNTLALSLKREGYQVVTAIDPENALLLAQEFSFDYVISDKLSDGEMAILGKIKSSLPDVRILMAVCANGDGEIPKTPPKWPVDGWIHKPLKIIEVKTALRGSPHRKPRKNPAGMGRLSSLEFKDAVRSFEKDLIEEALQRTNYVKSRAARLLNINRTTLIEKMKRLNIPP